MERIAVRDLNDHLLGYITKYTELSIKKEMDSWDTLSFQVPSSSQANRLLQNELRLCLGARQFVIKNCSPSRDNKGPTIKISAPSIAIDLNSKPRQVVGTYLGTELYGNWAPRTKYEMYDRVRYYGVVYECREPHTSGNSLAGSQWSYWTTCKIQAELVELVMTLKEFMQFALQDTGWKVGKLDDDGASRTFSGTWVSVPSLLKEGCEKFDLHVVYHDDTMTVDMVKEPGVDREVTIEYAKNLRGISKTADSTDFTTKLFAYGDEELTFNLVNVHTSNEHPLYQLQNLQSFIFNFDFFLAQGYTVDEIYKSVMAEGDGSPFIRINKLDMSYYIDDFALLRDAEKELRENLAHPQVTYKIDLLDLADAGIDPNEPINIGDWVWVRDRELGVDVKVRVNSMTVYPGYPEKTTAQLSNKDEFFGDAIASSLGYTEKMASNSTISNLMKNYINTFTTVINSSTGDLVWSDGQLTAIELDDNGKPTGNQVRLTPGGLGVSTNFGATYDNAITGYGVLANKVIANELHILSVGPNGIVIEPLDSGVRLNNTEGIIVQSQDKRFTAQMNAANSMSGASWGFSLYNGEFAQASLTTSGGYFYINGTRTTVPSFSNGHLRVGRNGYWYIFRETSLVVEDTIDKATRLPVLSRLSSGYLGIGGKSTGITYDANLDVIPGDNGKWMVGYPTTVLATYQGQALVFGVNMNGDAFFNGIVQAQDFKDKNGVSMLKDDGKIKFSYLDMGNIKLYGTRGDIEMTGKILLGDYPTTYVLVDGTSGSITMTGKTTIGNTKTYVTVDGGTGSIKMTGDITMGGSVNLGGNVTWSQSSSPIRALYARTNLSTPTNEYSTYPTSSTTGWHRTVNANYDVYGSYSYDGGKTWGPAMKLLGVDGENGKDGKQGPQGPPGDDATVTRLNICRALAAKYMNSSDGLFYDGYDLVVKAAVLYGDYIDASHIDLHDLSYNSFGGFGLGKGSTGTTETTGSMMYGSGGKSQFKPHVLVTNAGAGLKDGMGGELGVWNGGCHSRTEIGIFSDARLKKKIQYDFEKFKGFFMDLKPASFGYYTGTSNRRHTGFIAQDVLAALENNGISTKDAAFITHMEYDQPDPLSGLTDIWSLRYTEFISINTYMIQETIRELEAVKEENRTLRAEIDRIKEYLNLK